jgi:hypothetical protein
MKVQCFLIDILLGTFLKQTGNQANWKPSKLETKQTGNQANWKPSKLETKQTGNQM